MTTTVTFKFTGTFDSGLCVLDPTDSNDLVHKYFSDESQFELVPGSNHACMILVYGNDGTTASLDSIDGADSNCGLPLQIKIASTEAGTDALGSDSFRIRVK